MEKLKFYEIKETYINYLKIYDEKIPNVKYSTNDKFLCGILFKINDNSYYAPISSFTQKQRTNLIIRDIDNKALSSIRFSFMLPVPDNLLSEVMSIKDFNKENSKNKIFLNKELKFLNKNFNNVITKAKEIYNKMNNKQKPFVDVCCNYKLLESIASKYDEKTQKEYDILIQYIKDKYKDPKNFIKNQNLLTKEKGFEESIKNLIEKYKQLNVEIPVTNNKNILK